MMDTCAQWCFKSSLCGSVRVTGAAQITPAMQRTDTSNDVLLQSITLPPMQKYAFHISASVGFLSLFTVKRSKSKTGS